MKKIVSISLILLLIISIFCTNQVLAEEGSDGIEGIKDVMKNVGQAPSGYAETGTAKVINTIIGILQVAGTGISLIVISMLGIKYILASPSEKADVKKNIMPILIGCVLLFAAVQIIAVVENFTNEVKLVSG